MTFQDREIIHPKSFTNIPPILHSHISRHMLVELNEGHFSTVSRKGNRFLFHSLDLVIICCHSFTLLSTQNRTKLTKKLVKESVVYRRTALFQANLDGRHRSQITQDKDSKTRETQGTRVGHKVLKEAAVRTTWVESPVTYPSDLVLIQLTSRHEKSAKVIFH